MNKMLYFIYPHDSTTNFLLQIPKNISEKFGEEQIKTIFISANDESYEHSLNEIQNIPTDAIVIFMGHGQDDKLWGAESDTFDKKPLIKKSDAKIFKDKYLFCLSCNSNGFLRGSFSYSKIIGSIGFGSLPTEMSEVENSKKLKEQGVNEYVINKYKEILIELVSLSLCDMIEKELSFSELANRFLLRLNKKISEVIMDDKKNINNRILSDLLFQMKSEMVFI